MATKFQSLRNRQQKRNKKDAGISLVEMVVATAVMGVLSAVGLTATLGSVDKAKIASANASASDAARACMVAIAEGDAATFVIPDSVTGTDCAAGSTFTSNVSGLASQAVATVTATGLSLAGASQ